MSEPGDRTFWDRGRSTTQDASVSACIASLLTDTMGDCVMDDDNEPPSSSTSRTELDTHANMPVVGRNAFVISRTGETADVSAFTPDYKPMHVPIVDAALLYDCPYSGDEVIVLIRNALYFPTMENNLIPPFVMREAGVVVNDMPKIQATDPTTAMHSLYFPETGFRIPLSLRGVFSYFSTSRPTLLQLQKCEKVYLLTPAEWNPHCDSYARNEAAMLDCNGEMAMPIPKERYLMSTVAAN